jgi:hypothetical protein
MENNPNHVYQQLIKQVNGSLHRPLQYLFIFNHLTFWCLPWFWRVIYPYNDPILI